MINIFRVTMLGLVGVALIAGCGEAEPKAEEVVADSPALSMVGSWEVKATTSDYTFDDKGNLTRGGTSDTYTFDGETLTIRYSSVNQTVIYSLVKGEENRMEFLFNNGQNTVVFDRK